MGILEYAARDERLRPETLHYIAQTADTQHTLSVVACNRRSNHQVLMFVLQKSCKNSEALEYVVRNPNFSQDLVPLVLSKTDDPHLIEMVTLCTKQ